MKKFFEGFNKKIFKEFFTSFFKKENKSLLVMDKTSITRSIPLLMNRLFDNYVKQTHYNKTYIKINKIEQQNSSISNVVAYIGSRKSFKKWNISVSPIENKTWELNYTDKNHSSFVVALFNQKSMFEESKLIGEIEIKLGSFQTNRVTNHTFILRCPDRHSEPIRVSLSIHLNEDGSKPFQSCESNILNYEYEIIRKNHSSISVNQKAL